MGVNKLVKCKPLLCLIVGKITIDIVIAVIAVVGKRVSKPKSILHRDVVSFIGLFLQSLTSSPSSLSSTFGPVGLKVFPRS